MTMTISQGVVGGKTLGLTAFQLKVIALVCMTIDHVAAYGPDIPAIARWYSYFRLIGRIAAPIFLFLLVQSIRHTRSKPRFVLRLYLAGAAVGLLDTAMNVFFGEVLGYRTMGNILFTFFYVALYVLLIERLAAACRGRDVRAAALTAGAFLLSLVPSVFFQTLYGLMPTGTSMAVRYLFQGLRTSLIPSFYDVDYGIGLILLGLLLYAARTKYRQCGVFIGFCLFCLAGALVGMAWGDLYRISLFGLTGTFFDLSQCRMVLALPFLLLYNGERGRSCKWFFYWYYPVHRYAIIILAKLLT